jgi:hypothetical protein
MEWLRMPPLAPAQELRFDFLVWRMVLSLPLGFAVAVIYWFTQRTTPPAKDERSLFSTLVLLTILIAMVTQVIGDNVARAFGLVGALSIVRFRTVVEDTRDTAFVIFAVVVGMAVGAGYPEIALVGLAIGGPAALITRPRFEIADDTLAPWNLTVRVGLGPTSESLIAEVFRRHFGEAKLLSSATSRQGAALDLSYRVVLRPTTSATAFVGELNRVEGVQNVELRRL